MSLEAGHVGVDCVDVEGTGVGESVTDIESTLLTVEKVAEYAEDVGEEVTMALGDGKVLEVL